MTLVVGTASAQNPCSTTPIPSTLPASSGCIPLTVKPADGSPERVVWVPATFPMMSPAAKTVPAMMKYRELQIGVVGSYLNPDYNNGRNANIGGFASYTFRYIGAEVDASFTANSPRGIHETSIVAGPRFQYPTRFVTPYLKAQVGGGGFSGDTNHPTQDSKTYLVEQFGVGVDVRVYRHIKIRAIDASYQLWPNFPPNNLTPVLISSGVSYTF